LTVTLLKKNLDLSGKEEAEIDRLTVYEDTLLWDEAAKMQAAGNKLTAGELVKLFNEGKVTIAK
jgi:hypothetical protein